MKYDRKKALNTVGRIVVKVGSNVLSAIDGLNLYAVRSISRQICRLIDRKLEVMLVTSGAMAAGLKKIGVNSRPDDTPGRQAIAAVGQAGLIMEYDHAFDRYGIHVAQVLLTSDDLNDRQRYLNARNTIHMLLSWGVVPIVNENDTVRVESIQFGDNDHLAAMIGLLMDVDLVINLTDIDGLFNQNPRQHPDAELIKEVNDIGPEFDQIAGRIPGALGTGGMQSKIRAARKITAVGTPMIIANGNNENVLAQILDGEPVGTIFYPNKRRLTRRKCWIGYSARTEGTLEIDQGAADALIHRGKSLLPSGIIAVEGSFGIGAAVECRVKGDAPLGVGLVNYNADDIRRIMGCHSRRIVEILGSRPYDEVIHRDNLTITSTKESIHDT